MVYVTGDMHGDIERLYDKSIRKLKKNDVLIVCGDFGYIFYGGEKDAKKLEDLSKKPYTILFCDGNHENFDRLESYPVVDYCGGKAHKIAENVYHLIRGEIFEIEGKKVLAFGGAFSTDRSSRAEGYTYWRRELANDDDKLNAIKNLEKANMQCDIVITHTAPTYIIGCIYQDPELREQTGLTRPDPAPEEKWHDEFLNWIFESVKFDKWYFGHWHIDAALTENVTAVFEKIHTI
jgi:predicted MPP superfamily phosphohydrolase